MTTVQTMPERNAAKLAVEDPHFVAPKAATPGVVKYPRAIEFLYLDQDAVLAADLLDMPRAMEANSTPALSEQESAGLATAQRWRRAASRSGRRT